MLFQPFEGYKNTRMRTFNSSLFSFSPRSTWFIRFILRSQFYSFCIFWFRLKLPKHKISHLKPFLLTSNSDEKKHRWNVHIHTHIQSQWLIDAYFVNNNNGKKIIYYRKKKTIVLIKNHWINSVLLIHFKFFLTNFFYSIRNEQLVQNDLING